MEKSIQLQEDPVVLTFLAPADRCNQRCPACIIDRLREPVRSFELCPDDYACLVTQFVESGIPILGLSFQGYEVTLPKSWPYLEAAFAVAKRHGIRRSFVTNGMLLHKFAERAVVLDPHRISISLDGADQETNDRLRGLRGAFGATTTSLARFLKGAPGFRQRLAIVSMLYDEANFGSLLEMPRLIRTFGIPRWSLGFELDLVNGVQRPTQSKETLVGWIQRLQEVAEREGIRLHVNDEFGFFEREGGSHEVLAAKQLFDPDRVIRVEPSGHMRVGRETVREWDDARERRWNPKTDDAVNVAGFRAAGRTGAPRSERIYAVPGGA